MNIRIASATDVGAVRTSNEDAVLVCSDLEKQRWDNKDTSFLALGKYGAMMIVADGMGGANAGEVASSITVTTVKNYFSLKRLEEVEISEQRAHEMLAEAIYLSNVALMQHVVTHPDSIGLGTTIVITWIIDANAYIAWCGDSRCYCYNQCSGLRQLTKDHSYVQDLIDKGEITVKQAFTHPNNNVITRCIGDVDANMEPDTMTYQLKDGDILLLCSDGLCGYCENKAIEKVMLNSFDNILLSKEKLLDMALKAGGQDNITIALCSTLPDGQDSPLVNRATLIKRFFNNIVKQ